MFNCGLKGQVKVMGGFEDSEFVVHSCKLTKACTT